MSISFSIICVHLCVLWTPFVPMSSLMNISKALQPQFNVHSVANFSLLIFISHPYKLWLIEMSSVNTVINNFSSPTFIPLTWLFFIILMSINSTQRMKINGEIGSPCLHPLLITNYFEVIPPWLIANFVFFWNTLIILLNESPQLKKQDFLKLWA